MVLSDGFIYIYGLVLFLLGWLSMPRLLRAEENEKRRVILSTVAPIFKWGGIFIVIISLF